MAVTTRKTKLPHPASPSREVIKLTSRLIRRTIAKNLPTPQDALHSLADGTGAGVSLVQRLRSIPIQCSMDIAVPLEIAYEEWMQLESLPEGVHRIQQIEREGDDYLVGRIADALTQHSEWEAEIREERPNESFAWRSVKGTDCVGWVTFHRLSERLTRLELELDVVPVSSTQAFELLLHIADRRAETDLRRFKAELERISPDDYASLVEDLGDDEVPKNDEEE